MLCSRILLVHALCGILSLQVVAQVTWRTDSLMMTWTVQERLKEVGTSLNRGVVPAVGTANLLEDLRLEATGIPVFVDSNVVMYTTLYGERLRDHFRVLLGTSMIYFPTIEKELALRGLPAELKYLPMALSASNILAGSRQGGAGLWMLTYPMALRYGLEVTEIIDERHDAEKSTIAAIRHLGDLYARYRDWGLTIMAFASGPANVTRAQQHNHGATDYQYLYSQLAEGVREVPPLLMAFIHLANNASKLGMEPISMLPLEEVDTVTTGHATDMRAVARAMKLPYERLRALNPVLCAGKAPAGQALYLPRWSTECFLSLTDSIKRVEERIARVSAENPETTSGRFANVEVQRSIRYKVRAGDSLGKIAAQHNVTVRQLKTWNSLQSDRIDAGRTLVIHVRKREPVKLPDPGPQPSDEDGPVNSRPTPPSQDHAASLRAGTNGWSSYTVQRGDTLYHIAKRFPGLTANEIMKVNGIGAAIIPGQKLRIPRP